MSSETWAMDASFKTKQTPWWLLLMSGILSIIVGFLLVTSPVKTTHTVVVFLAIWWIISGIFTLIGMFMDHSAWLWKLIIGIISIVAGVLILRNPWASTVVLPFTLILLLGIQGLISGILMLIMGFTGGGLGSIIMGIISAGLGAILLFNWNNPAMALSLIWVAGFFLIIGGIIQIVKIFLK
jgi:uncharacterized membrane protein HdeD (DUF308 family)